MAKDCQLSTERGDTEREPPIAHKKKKEQFPTFQVAGIGTLPAYLPEPEQVALKWLAGLCCNPPADNTGDAVPIRFNLSGGQRPPLEPGESMAPFARRA